MRDTIKDILQECIAIILPTNVDGSSLDINLTVPKQTSMGDLTSNVSFGLAKILQQTPFEVASELCKLINERLVVATATPAQRGFINFKFNSDNWIKESLNGILTTDPKMYQYSSLGNNKKVLIEHTSVNPNKSMHIGHIRNAILGDSLSRLFKRCGYRVEVQNYIDDTGSQVADTTNAIINLKQEIPEGDPFDEYCWDVYSKINKLYEKEEYYYLIEKKQEITKALEEGYNDIALKSREIVDKILKCHLELLSRFNIHYDLLVYESDVIKFGFWEKAFEQLKLCENFTFNTQGIKKGCWVLKGDDQNEDKIFVRSNGTKVYTAKDTAYHMWKFNLLEKDFLYRSFPYETDNRKIITTSLYGLEKNEYGKGDMIINVIDKRQSYPQNMVKFALKQLGHPQQASNYCHVAYGVVNLSNNTAIKMGYSINQEKSYLTMSGRKGIGVQVRKLLELFNQKVQQDNKNRGTKEKDAESISFEEISTAAIRHYMLKYKSESDIIFDIDEALQLIGNTGPYLQYTYARLHTLIGKAESFDTVFTYEGINEYEYKLVTLVSQWPKIVELSCKKIEIKPILDYCYDLCSLTNSFYQNNPILKVDNEIKEFRLTLVRSIIKVLDEGFYIIGIKGPYKM